MALLLPRTIPGSLLSEAEVASVKQSGVCDGRGEAYFVFWCKDMSACIIYSTKITTTIYHAQFQEVVIRSIPISDCTGQCEWQGNGRVIAGLTAWERHGMCESVFKTAGERQGDGRVNGLGTAWYV
jgi:hypothetical protein